MTTIHFIIIIIALFINAAVSIALMIMYKARMDRIEYTQKFHAKWITSIEKIGESNHKTSLDLLSAIIDQHTLLKLHDESISFLTKEVERKKDK